MSCQFKDECPSYSGWCEGVKDDFSRCIPFIINAVKGARQENAALRERLDKKFKLIAQQGQELNRRDEVIKKQEAKLDHVTAERDAAMEDCSGMCITCAFNHDCAKHDNNDAGPSIWHCDCEDWQWRGSQKEDDGND